MASPKRMATFLLFTLCLLAVDAQGWQTAKPGDAQGRFSEKEQTARQEVLESQRWKQATEKFDAWLSVQTAYDGSQVKELKAELQHRIAKMPANELKQLLGEMEERLDVLMSPEVDQARRWANRYYTEKAQQKMAEKLRIEEPMKMTASQLRAALERFQEQRAAQRSAANAFNSSRQSQLKALGSYRKQEQSALEKGRAQSARNVQRGSSFGSPYAPRRSTRPQTYSPAYRPTRYSIGPWGGVWIGR